MTCLRRALISLALVPALFAQNSPWQPGQDKDMLRTAADRVLKLSEKTLPSGQRQVSFNGFHGWYYQTLLFHHGLAALGRFWGNPADETFGNRRLDEIAVFVGEGKKDNNLGFYFNPRALWTTGLAGDWMARAEPGREDVYLEFSNRFRDFISKQKNQEGVLLDGYTHVRTDDAYLLFQPLIQLARLDGQPGWRNQAIEQVLGTHRLLFQKDVGLYHHALDFPRKKFSEAYWGRGNAWMALAWVDVLEHLPADDPRRPVALEAFREQVNGLRRWQAPEGGWRQVMDAPESWVETSCTGMFVYAIARGIREGWLPASDMDLAEKGWAAIRPKIDAKGSIFDICPGTGPGNREFYLNRPREKDNPHGIGPVLLAGSEMLLSAKK